MAALNRFYFVWYGILGVRIYFEIAVKIRHIRMQLYSFGNISFCFELKLVSFTWFREIVLNEIHVAVFLESLVLAWSVMITSVKHIWVNFFQIIELISSKYLKCSYNVINVLMYDFL